MIDAGRHAGIVYQVACLMSRVPGLYLPVYVPCCVVTQIGSRHLQASSIIRHAQYSRFAAEFGFPPGMRSVAAFQPSGGKGGSGGGNQEGSTDTAPGKPTQPGRYVLAVHQPESWGPHGADAITR